MNDAKEILPGMYVKSADGICGTYVNAKGFDEAVLISSNQSVTVKLPLTFEVPNEEIIFTRGARVTYIPFHGDRSMWEEGIVKSLDSEDPDYVFVVYKCNGEWHNYSNYTGQRTKKTDLKIGWL